MRWIRESRGGGSSAVPVFLDAPLEALHKRPMPTALEICKFTSMVVALHPPVIWRITLQVS